MKEMYRKLQISVLWIFLAVSMTNGDGAGMDGTWPPGRVSQQWDDRGMEVTAVTVSFALSMIVPMVMPFLTLTLSHAANRWGNVIVGLAVAIVIGFDLVTHLTDGNLGGIALITATMLVAALLTSWLAWRLPAPQATVVEHERELHT
jgi:hypothetical protein